MTEQFSITIEVVPPSGFHAEAMLSALEPLSRLPIKGFSVATNPVAKPRMSALAACILIRRHVRKPTTLHCTTRDHNRLGVQSLLWGARALEIKSVLIMTGDRAASAGQRPNSVVRDIDVFHLIALAREAELRTGVVVNYPADQRHCDQAVRRLERKIEAGAQFVVTQPVFDEEQAAALLHISTTCHIPMILGILPLQTPRHAEFLNQRVVGIDVPDPVREQMAAAPDPAAAGVVNARKMLMFARRHFAGACIMPPFHHYEIVSDILGFPEGEALYR